MVVASIVLALHAGNRASAQQPRTPIRPYDGIQAGLDAFQLAEEQRRAGAAQQMLLHEQLLNWRWAPVGWYGFPFHPQPLVRQPIDQWQGQTGANRWESHPVYEVAQPPIVETPKPAPPRRSGPREY